MRQRKPGRRRRKTRQAQARSSRSRPAAFDEDIRVEQIGGHRGYGNAHGHDLPPSRGDLDRSLHATTDRPRLYLPGLRWPLPGGRCPAARDRVPAAVHWSFQDGVQECAGQGDSLIESWRGPGDIGRRLWVAAPPHSLVGDRESICEDKVSVCRAGQDRDPERGARDLLSGSDQSNVPKRSGTPQPTHTGAHRLPDLGGRYRQASSSLPSAGKYLGELGGRPVSIVGSIGCHL